jgi:5-methyltetrahydrofolate--homocysteine methyltransferase
MDLHDNPELIDSYLKKLTKIWIKIHEEFSMKILSHQQGTSSWAPMWAPGKMYILQSDFSYMISPEMFERFVLPDLRQCCDYLDYSFYHLDGRGQIPHLDLILDIENLDGVQWIPGEGSGEPQDYIDLLKKIIDAEKLCQVYVTPEGAIKIKQQIGSKGFVFHIVHDDIDNDSANELIKKLYA